MTPEEYRQAYKVHFDAYFTGSNNQEASYRADLIMGLTELVAVLERMADSGNKHRNGH